TPKSAATKSTFGAFGSTTTLFVGRSGIEVNAFPPFCPSISVNVGVAEPTFVIRKTCPSAEEPAVLLKPEYVMYACVFEPGAKMTCVGKRFGVVALLIAVQVGFADSASVLCQILPSPPATMTTLESTGETATSTIQLKLQFLGSSGPLTAFQSAPVP